MNKFPTLQQVAEQPEHAPIWVLNNAAQSILGVAGDISMGIPKLNGSKIDALHIRMTWLPQDVTATIPRAQLLGSSEFRQALSKKLIVIISNEYAEELMADEGAAAEQRKLDEFDRLIANQGPSRTLTSGIGEIQMASTNPDSQKSGEVVMVSGASDAPKGEIIMASPAQTGGTEILDFGNRASLDVSSTEFSPGFNALMIRIKEMADIDALNELRTHARFRRSELTHLSNTLIDKPKCVAAIGALLNSKPA